MAYTIYSTADYHVRSIESLGWELTVCNALHHAESPCRNILQRNASYGDHLYEFLGGFMPIADLTSIMEIGGGYGTLMRDFLAKPRRKPAMVTMLDISPLLLSRQKETLAGLDVRFVLADFLEADIGLLEGHELVIMNENLGDFPTYLDVDPEILSAPSHALDPPLRKVQQFFRTYALDELPASPFHFNAGAVEALEKLCRSQVPYIFIGEHSCEASVPPSHRNLIRLASAGHPEKIALKGHDEYTICFSNLVRVATFFNYRVLRGPFADFLPFELTGRIRTALSAMNDGSESIRHFVEDLYKYEYLVLIHENSRH